MNAIHLFAFQQLPDGIAYNLIKRRQIMTVQELIDKLNGIEDKDVDVFLDSGDINLWNANEVYIDDDKTIVIIAN